MNKISEVDICATYMYIIMIERSSFFSFLNIDVVNEAVFEEGEGL